ncbi:Ras guanine nucleotide exchange factor domain containing protein [Amanita muscaria]
MSVTVLSFPSSHSASVYDNDEGSSSKPASPMETRNDGEASPSSPKWRRRSRLDFDAAFPSIIKTAICLRDARDNNTLQAFKAIAEVFLMCAKSAIHEVHRTCIDPHSDGSYELAKSAAELIISLMHGKIKTDVQDVAAMDMMLDLSDMLIANLKELTTVALRITREKKPLPTVPQEPQAETDGQSDQTSVAGHRLSFFDYELINSDEYEESYGPSSHRFLFGNRIRGLLKSTRSASSSEQLSSGASFVGDDSQSALSGSTLASRSGRDFKMLRDVPSVLRQSAYLLPSEQAPFQFNVEAPLPSQSRDSVQFNDAGEVKGASFAALVRMLTSKDAILDPDLAPTFFAGFRIFGSVELFFEELQKRFDEVAPDDIGTTQLRVWTREAFLTRLRVGKILLLWLTDYWQPDYDDGILGHLHQYAVERIRNELPKSLATPILEMIDSRMTGDEVYVTSHKDRYFKILASQVVQTKIAVTGFVYPGTFDEDISKVLAFFDTEVGNEEFAQQLTAIASAMFRKINPQDIVLYWHEHSDSELGPALSETTNFARSLAMFVTHSIVLQEERSSRYRRIEFWTTIATDCLHHRNYFVSHCVFAGLTHSAVSRLKRTILVRIESTKFPASIADKGARIYPNIQRLDSAGLTNSSLVI